MNKITYMSPVADCTVFVVEKCLMDCSYGVAGAAGGYDSSHDLIYTDEF